MSAQLQRAPTQDVVMADQEFKRIASIIHREAGICITDNKRSLAFSRLSKRLKALHLTSFSDYCDLVESRDGADEQLNMVAALTTNVTSFFREPHHFKTLQEDVLPPLIARAREGGRVRIWSAGCSNGQEPYSIAMTVLGMASDMLSRDFKVLATDIDPFVLRHAKGGVYPEAAIDLVPAELKNKFLTRGGDKDDPQWTVGPEPRRMVTFNRLNLMGNWPMKGPFDIIFCRNVVIYFDDPTKDKIWGQYASLLNPDGYLFIGHSERLSGPASSLFQSEGITTYKKTV